MGSTLEGVTGSAGHRNEDELARAGSAAVQNAEPPPGPMDEVVRRAMPEAGGDGRFVSGEEIDEYAVECFCDDECEYKDDCCPYDAECWQ